MTTDREALAAWIDGERDRIIDFLRGFLRARSPNPPGDTRDAAAFICRFLDAEALPYRIIAPEETMPNIVGSFDGAGSGRHLVLNGHTDVFPVDDQATGWTHDPWAGELAGGRIYGRGACDMKAGTTASIFTYAYLHRLRHRLEGRLTLTAVSDEETLGPWGARYLMEHHPEVRGDCLLNGEPGGLRTIRFAEKGSLWLRLTVQTTGAHGAYTHASASATKIAARLIAELEALTDMEVAVPDNVMRAWEEGQEAADEAMGAGAADITREVTLNIGTIHGGIKNNMIPGHCTFEADIRLPPGLDKEPLMAAVERIVARHPEVSMEETGFNPSSYCDPFGDMVDILQDNVETMKGFRPTPIVSIGGTDARLWRYHGIPAYVYGPSPSGMGSHDEHVEVEDFLHVVRTHVLSAYDYLTRG